MEFSAISGVLKSIAPFKTVHSVPLNRIDFIKQSLSGTIEKFRDSPPFTAITVPFSTGVPLYLSVPPLPFNTVIFSAFAANLTLREPVKILESTV